MKDPGASVRPLPFIAVFYTAWVVWLAALPSLDPPKTSFFSHLLVGTVARLAIWCLLPALWIIVVERRTLVSALRPIRGYSSRLALMRAASFAVLMLVGLRVTRGHWFLIPDGHSPLQYISSIVAVALLAFGEEFTFRGVLLSSLLRSGSRFWIANALVALAFALSHWPGWMMFGGTSAIDIATATMRLFVFGLIMGGLVRSEGGLVGAITTHTLNDVLVGTLLS